MVTLTVFLLAKFGNLTREFGNVFLDSDLSSNKVYVGNWGTVNPLIFGRTCGVWMRA